MRLPLALWRLSEWADGQVVLRLRRPARDGTVALASPPLGLDPLSLVPAARELRPRRLDWAALLRRVWGAEVLRCPGGGRRKIAAVVSHPELAAQGLETLGVYTEAPPLAKARAPHTQLRFEPPVDGPGIDPSGPDRFDSHPEY